MLNNVKKQTITSFNIFLKFIVIVTSVASTHFSAL